MVPEIGAPGAWESDYKVIPSLRTKDDGICHASNSTDAMSPYGGLPKASHVISKVQGESSMCSEDVYYLEIDKSGDIENLDMTVAVVPEPSDFGDKSNEAKSSDRSDSDLSAIQQADDMQQVAPLSYPDLTAQPVVGTVVADIVEGETQYYATPVEWGQALDVTVEVLEDTAGGDNAQQRKLEFFVQNSLAQDQQIIGKKYLSTAEFSSPVVFGTKRSVSYSNVDNNATWFGGKHYVQVSFSNVNKEVSESAEQQPVKYRMTFTPIGTPVTGPQFDTGVLAAEQTDQADPAVQSQAEKSTEPSMIWWLLAGITLVIIGGLIALLIWLFKKSKP